MARLAAILVLGWLVPAPVLAQGVAALGSPWPPGAAPTTDAATPEPTAAVEPLAPAIEAPIGSSPTPSTDLGLTPSAPTEPIEASATEVPPADAAPLGVLVHAHATPSSRPGLVLHDRTGGGDTPLCPAPCDLRLEPGEYELDIAIDGGAPRRPDHSVLELDGPTELTLAYETHAVIRASGWIMFGLGLPTGAGLIVLGLFVIGGLGMVIPGAILAGFSLFYWLGAAFRNDHIDVRAEPLTIRF